MEPVARTVQSRSLEQILVPEPRADQTYVRQVGGQSFHFVGLKRLLGAADLSKAGDRQAGLAPSSLLEREVARSILSELTLEHLYERPLTDSNGRVDAVMRVGYDVDMKGFLAIKDLTLGALKDVLMEDEGAVCAAVGRSLTPVMAAALAKLCDTHELIFLAKKIVRPTRARTQLGLPGTLASRLQPNHPTDDLRGLTLLTWWGWSIGSGDALLGVNPAMDTVENLSRILHHLDRLRRDAGVPTQLCVLGHVKTQLAALKQGAPVEILFQSLAGTEATNLMEFDISVPLLDDAYARMASDGPLHAEAAQFMYFETGQGSELTYGKHHGIDMTTLEALCYGLARRWDPFMVNNVTGFIGPETHLDNFEMIYSNLQDHFMGKLLGLPMGMAPCYTLHASCTLEGQQLATQALTAAGANYYMDVCLNTDRMLAYFDTSGYDVQTLRELYGRQPGPEFLEWALARGLYTRTQNGALKRGPTWGDLSHFCPDQATRSALYRATPALYPQQSSGPRPVEAITRKILLQQAGARAAVFQELDRDAIAQTGPVRWLQTLAGTKEAHLASPDLGARLDAASARALVPESADVQLLISDGLSAAAVHHNLPLLRPVLEEALKQSGFSFGVPCVVPYGRVKLSEVLAECLDAALIVCLIGERPGGDADAACSLSAYLMLRLKEGQAQVDAARFSGHSSLRYEYTVLSNIYQGGLPPLEAAGCIVEKLVQMRQFQAAGNRLEALLTVHPAH